MNDAVNDAVDRMVVESSGTDRVVLRNEHVSAVISPRHGGRLLSITRTGGASAPGALVDVGHEDDRWEVVVARPNAGGVEAVLGHVRGGCPFLGSVKIYRLHASATHVEVDYRLAPLRAPFTVRWEPTGAVTTSRARRFTVQIGPDGPRGDGWVVDLRTGSAGEPAVAVLRSPP